MNLLRIPRQSLPTGAKSGQREHRRHFQLAHSNTQLNRESGYSVASPSRFMRFCRRRRRYIWTLQVSRAALASVGPLYLRLALDRRSVLNLGPGNAVEREVLEKAERIPGPFASQLVAQFMARRSMRS
jgi:hypothetical protein